MAQSTLFLTYHNLSNSSPPVRFTTSLPTFDHHFGTLKLRVSVSNSTFFIFGIDTRGDPFTSEYVVFDLQSILRGTKYPGASLRTTSIGTIKEEVPLAKFPTKEELNGGLLVRMNQTLSNGCTFSLWFEFESMECVSNAKFSDSLRTAILTGFCLVLQRQSSRWRLVTSLDRISQIRSL